MDIEEGIREEYRVGASYRELAKKYRLSFRKLAEIIKGGAAEAYLPTWRVC
jgi:Mor family transcriptional regulator